MKSLFGARGDGKVDDTAAFQKALDYVIRNQKNGGPPLWVPAGTYRISATLTITGAIGFGMIGEDPKTTSIVWAGPAGQPMLLLNGSPWARFSRITWNGNFSADSVHRYIFDGVTGHFPTLISETDEIFLNASYGIRIGWASNIEIDRSQFTGMTEAGVSVEDWNGLGIWIRDSRFTSCKVGVTNRLKAGNFMVYDSVFLNSTEADMEMHATSQFAARRNVSVGSAAFFYAAVAGINDAQITLQDNVVANTSGTPIVLGNQGPLMLIDNTFISAPGASYPVAIANDYVPASLLSIGNKYDAATYASGQFQRVWSVDDQQLAVGALTVSVPEPAAFQPNLRRRVIEVKPGASTTSIQNALDRAAQATGSRPVVHLQSGTYALSSPLQIAAASDVQLVGDGALYSTYLQWTGEGSGPMIIVQDPARATLRDVGIYGADRATAVEVHVNDAPGSLVRLWKTSTSIDDGDAVVSDGLNQAVIDILGSCLYAWNTSVTAIGGAPQSTTFGRVSQFGGEHNNQGPNGSTFAVSNGGNMTVEDDWRDLGGNTGENFVNLQGTTGSLTLQGGFFDTPGANPFTLDSFQGDVSLIGYKFTGNLTVLGDSSALNFSAIADEGETSPTYWNDQGTPNPSTLQLSDYDLPSGADQPMPDAGSNDPGTLRAALSRVRNLRPQPYATLPAALTDFRVQGVFIEHSTTAFHFVPTSGAGFDISGFSLNDGAGNELVPLASATGTVLGIQPQSGLPVWNLIRQTDGTYQILALGQNAGVASNLAISASVSPQAWVLQPDGSGFFSIRQANSSLLLSRGANGLATLSSSPAHWMIQPVN